MSRLRAGVDGEGHPYVAWTLDVVEAEAIATVLGNVLHDDDLAQRDLAALREAARDATKQAQEVARR